MSETLEARGGRPGGAGTSMGQRVIVRLADGVLDVFAETQTVRLHASMVASIGLVPAGGLTGEALRVTAERMGCEIPVRFDGEQRAVLERIVAAVRAAD